MATSTDERVVADSDAIETKVDDRLCSADPAANNWALAIEALDGGEKELLLSLLDETCSPLNAVKDVLAATERRKADCLKKRWKVKINGRELVVRDILDKISFWATKFLKIGDTLVQIDPVHSAAPWAGIRLIIQTAVNDYETFGFVLNSIERLTNHISICAIFELQYLQPEHQKLAVYDNLMRAVLDLYAKILGYLCMAIRYYKLGTISRQLKSIVTSKADMDEKYKPIDEAQALINKYARLAEAQKLNMILDTVTELYERDKAVDLGKAIQELCGPIARTADQLDAINDGLARETRVRILKAISTISYPQHHKTARKGRLEGSGEWLLQKPAFKQWRCDSSSSVLWLHGIPGSGKTKLTSLVVDELVEGNKIAYFYCMRTPAEPYRGECDKILASLVRQLASLQPNTPILQAVVDQYQDAIDGLAEFEDQAWTVEESETVLRLLLVEYPAVTIIIDALDEVQFEDRQTLLNILARLMKDAPNLLKIFISSRDNYDILLQLEGSPNIYIDADENAADIAKFIEDRLDNANLLHGKLSEDLRSKIVQVLTMDARGMFRWVELQIQSLVPLKVSADILDRLGKLPPTLEGSYWELYQTILKSGKHASQLAVFTFQWLLYAKMTVQADGFASIASAAFSAANEHASTVITSGEIIDVCSNLIVLRNDTFELAHLSVREFLEALPERKVDIMKPEKGNEALAIACLRFFDEQTREELSKLAKKLMKMPEHDKETSNSPKTEIIDMAGGEKNATAAGEAISDVDFFDDLDKTEMNEAEIEETFDLSSEGDDKELEPKSIEEQIAQTFVDRGDKTAISYACTHWPIHATSSGSLRKEMPLSGLINKLLITENDPRKVTQAYTIWCACARLMPNTTDIMKAAEMPPSPIWMACLFDWAETAEMIYRLNKYDGINDPRDRQTPLVYSVVKGSVRLTETIIRYGGHELLTSQTTQAAEALLVVAAKAKDDDMVSFLLGEEHGGLYIEAEALRVTAGLGYCSIMTMLLSHDEKVIRYGGFSALSSACRNGALAAVELLLAAGSPTARGGALVAAALSQGHHEITKLLLERGIGLEDLSRNLVLAISQGDEPGAQILRDRGATLEPDAIARAIKAETPTASIRLIKAGYNVNGHFFREQSTPLHLAARAGLASVLRELLAADADVNARDRSNQTALHVAAGLGRHECSVLLLDAGADVLAEDYARKIPLDVAEDKDHMAVADLIRSRMEAMLEDLQKGDLSKTSLISDL